MGKPVLSILSILAIGCLYPSCAMLAPDEDFEACDADGSCSERKALLQQSSRQHNAPIAQHIGSMDKASDNDNDNNDNARKSSPMRPSSEKREAASLTGKNMWHESDKTREAAALDGKNMWQNSENTREAAPLDGKNMGHNSEIGRDFASRYAKKVLDKSKEVREACPLSIVGMKNAKGNAEPLTEQGFLNVRACCCPAQMREFIRRLVESKGNVVCEQGGLGGIVPYFYCDDYPDSGFADLEEEVGPLRAGQAGKCPWIGFGIQPQFCPPLDPVKCPQFSGATNPPCVGCATTTTTTTTTTATTTASTCAGDAKDIFLVLDASNSVKTGWTPQQNFAADLVNAIAANGNPKGHRINAHWFADFTSPTCVAVGPNWCVASGAGSVAIGDQHNPSRAIFEPNNIGIFSTDAAQIATDIGNLVYANIKAGNTDHPQVFHTADAAFSQTGPNAPFQNKMVVLLTDGATYMGDSCPTLAVMQALVGTCGSPGVCDQGGANACDTHRCMCGLYHATLFKQNNPDITLAIVAIANPVKANGIALQSQMAAMASPNQMYYASSFADLETIKSTLVAGLCQ